MKLIQIVKWNFLSGWCPYTMIGNTLLSSFFGLLRQLVNWTALWLLPKTTCVRTLSSWSTSDQYGAVTLPKDWSGHKCNRCHLLTSAGREHCNCTIHQCFLKSSPTPSSVVCSTLLIHWQEKFSQWLFSWKIDSTVKKSRVSTLISRLNSLRPLIVGYCKQCTLKTKLKLPTLWTVEGLPLFWGDVINIALMLLVDISRIWDIKESNTTINVCPLYFMHVLIKCVYIFGHCARFESPVTCSYEVGIDEFFFRFAANKRVSDVFK